MKGDRKFKCQKFANQQREVPADIFLFEVNKRNTRKRY